MLGVIQGHHATRLNEIKDGTSYTLLIGEKNLDPDDYNTGQTGATTSGGTWDGTGTSVAWRAINIKSPRRPLPYGACASWT